MQRKYPKLFSPIYLGANRVRVRNRIQADPTLIPLLTPENHPTAGFTAYYASKAKGGAGIVTIGETAVEWVFGRSHDYQVNLAGSRSKDALARVADEVHRYGALINMELCHGGVLADLPFINGRKPIGPSPYQRPSDGLITDAMSVDQMRMVARAYADSVETLMIAGFDMACVYMGNGWLLGSFLSPFYNQRKDEYGGSVENRCRFPLMVLDAIRERVGNGILLELRISASEFDPFYDYPPEDRKKYCDNGLNINDSIAAMKLMEDKVDVIEAFMGNRADPHCRHANKPTCFMPNGYYASLAGMAKEAGVKKPLMAVGSMDDPALAEKFLANGDFDMIGIGRALIADPEWPNKVRRDQEEEIRPCLRCFHCLDRNTGRYNSDKVLRFSTNCAHRFMCSVNPEIGFQEKYFPPSAEKRKVFIVGSGPAGMQAAITLADRGHEVTIFEKDAQLGGLLSFADKVPFKQVIKKYKDYLARQVRKRPIELRLNTRATPEMLEAEKPDVVIMAIGARPVLPPIPGINIENVILAVAACKDPALAGQKVVVIGGGQAGCEAGLYLADLGREVTVVEMGPTIARDAAFTHRIALLEQIERKLVVMTGTTCVEITPGGVLVKNAEGDLQPLAADTVVLATGYEPLSDEADAFADVAYDVICIGDCGKVGDINDATRAGFNAGVSV